MLFFSLFGSLNVNGILSYCIRPYGINTPGVVLPMNGVTFRLYSVTLVSSHDIVHNFGLSGQRTQNSSDACPSLPSRRMPMCRDAVRQCLDRENHLYLFFKDPIVQIPIRVKERVQKALFSPHFCQNSKGNSQSSSCSSPDWAPFSRRSLRSRISADLVLDSFSEV
jgi:hypothetical protein